MTTPSTLRTLANTRIVVDTSSNVPDDFLQKYRMIEVPTLVIFGQDSYQNKVELSNDEFYVKLAAAKTLPTTSQPPPSFFANAYQRAFDEGAEHVWLITVSSKLSGTFNSATLAAQEFDPERITLWDANSVSLGCGLQAMMLARWLETGMEAGKLLARMTQLRSQIIGYVALETLKYVARSGRVSNLQAGIGELLQVKPILELWDGNATVCARIRGRKRSFQEVIDRMQKYYGDRPIHAGVLHANALVDAEALLADARQVLNIQEVYYSDIGPAIATLAGPLLVGLAGCPTDL